MNPEHDELSEPEQQSLNRRLIRLLQEQYPLFAMYAWHGYQQYGRGALILDTDAPTPLFLYISLAQTHVAELLPSLVSLMEVYDPQTSIVVTMRHASLGYIWYSQRHLRVRRSSAQHCNSISAATNQRITIKAPTHYGKNR